MGNRDNDFVVIALRPSGYGTENMEVVATSKDVSEAEDRAELKFAQGFDVIVAQVLSRKTRDYDPR